MTIRRLEVSEIIFQSYLSLLSTRPGHRRRSETETTASHRTDRGSETLFASARRRYRRQTLRPGFLRIFQCQIARTSEKYTLRH